VLGDESLEFTDELRVHAEREVGIDPLHDHCEPKLHESPPFAFRELVRAEIGERFSSPETECLAEGLGGPSGIAACKQLTTLREELLEAGEVDLRGRDLECVSGCPGHEHANPVTVAECPPQARDRSLQCVRCRLARPRAEEFLDKDIAGDDLVRMQEEQREESALALTPEAHRSTFAPDLERAEQAEVETGLEAVVLSHGSDYPTADKACQRGIRAR
jgi:hypothetical protein